MCPEDEDYMNAVLRTLSVEKYKLSETPTRFKLIVQPDAFELKKLHDIQHIKGPVGIEVDLKRGVFIECLKTGSSRKRRRVSVANFTGTLPKTYRTKKYEKAIRWLVGDEDTCAFTIKEDKNLIVRNAECVTYHLLKCIEDCGFRVVVNVPQGQLELSV